MFVLQVYSCEKVNFIPYFIFLIKINYKNKADHKHKTQQIFFLFHSDFPLSSKRIFTSYIALITF